MALTLLSHETSLLARPRAAALLAVLDRAGEVAPWRGLLGATWLVGMAAFVLGIGNRFTRGPLFLYIPEVDLIPPVGRAAWQQAFVIHQQSPLYALCGGYQVGGMESLTVYQLLYVWEWLRIGSVATLCALGVLLAAIALRRSVRTQVLLGAALLAAAYLVLRFFADHAGLFASINVGQHRHALDVTFASLALALLLVAVLTGGRRDPAPFWRLAWAIPLALAIGFGALIEALDAGVLWRTFPGYADGLLPASDRLLAFVPVWRNLTENGYLIQACHRVLSFGLVIAALAWLLAALWRGRPWGRAALLLALLCLDGALGAATLRLGEPVALSIVHQVAAILVLAAACHPGADGSISRLPSRSPDLASTP
jgi:cytochrome c oxidase assembly protein subunit 15